MNPTVSVSPHARSPETVSRIMWSVFVCLLPAGCAGVFFFGWYAAVVVAISVFTCVIVEAVIQRATGRPVTVSDGSAAVTGLLLGYVLPPNCPWYSPVLGSIIAIGVAKHAFGGLGNNIWNPALVGRAFLHFAHLSIMSPSKWPILVKGKWVVGNILNAAPADAGKDVLAKVDAIAQATPLFKEVPVAEFYKFGWFDLLIGNRPGCIGETCAAALILGALYLIVKRHVRWQVPVLYVGSVALLTWAIPIKGTTEWFAGDPLYHSLAGGLVIGAFFMATDMVSTPLTRLGMCIFAIGAGLLTALIRLQGGFPEGVCYSILLMNTATPLIDRFTAPRVFGTGRRHA